MWEQKKSVLYELISSFKFYRESKKGKYSLATYLDIVGEYTDRMILQCEKEKYTFLGGNCKVINNTIEDTYDFRINVYFENRDGKKVMKEATRQIQKSRFTSETEKELQTEKIFEINRP